MSMSSGPSPTQARLGSRVSSALMSGFMTLASDPQRAFGVIDHGRMAAGIEQHVALLVPDQGAADRKIDGFAAVGAGHVDALLHAEAPGGKEVQFHGVFSVRMAAALLIAATMF